MTSDGTHTQLPQKRRLFARRIAAVITVIVVSGTLAVVAVRLNLPFPGLWHFFAPVAAAVVAACVVRGPGLSGQVGRAAAMFYLPALVVWFTVLALLLARGA